MKYDIIVIGGGGREHALIKALKKSPEVGKIYALPGNAGMEGDAERADIAATDIKQAVEFAKSRNVGFAVIGPDDPLVLGMADAFLKAGIRVFGPSKAAAAIEGSKIFAKNLMRKYGIPTADYRVFRDRQAALAHVKNCPLPAVIKADGLALGKGVIIAESRKDAEDAVNAMMQDKIFGESGANIVVEEYLTGPEVTVLAFTDGKTVAPLPSSMDHKRAYDGDTGPNTGGMGVVAPNPHYTKEIAERCAKEIFTPTVDALNQEGRTFKGLLYFGLMLTGEGPKVIEYNCRFGDPEAQAVLPLLENDLFTVMKAVEAGTLSDIKMTFRDAWACTVVMASAGYPSGYKKGLNITFDQDISGEICFAGTARKDGGLVTNGGRVLCVTNTAADLHKAVEASYADVKKIHFEGAFYRADIGERALSAQK